MLNCSESAIFARHAFNGLLHTQSCKFNFRDLAVCQGETSFRHVSKLASTRGGPTSIKLLLKGRLHDMVGDLMNAITMLSSPQYAQVWKGLRHRDIEDYRSWTFIKASEHTDRDPSSELFLECSRALLSLPAKPDITWPCFDGLYVVRAAIPS